MILQELVFPASDDDLQLCFRYQSTDCTVRDREIYINPGGYLSTDTFYNEFDLGTWQRFCHLQDLAIEIEYEGDLQVVIKSRTCKGSVRNHEKVELHARSATTTRFPIPLDFSGRFFCECNAMGKEAKISNIRFSSSYNPGESDLGIVICTFNREEMIRRTIKILENEILQNPSSRLYGRFRITVTDNGRTLQEQDDENLTIVHSANNGGTGGFIQGLLRFMNGRNPPSFIVFMDDDAEVYSETIERTWAFMSCLKKEFNKAILSGAMIRKDAPGILHESIAGWNGIRLRNRKTGLNLGEPKHLDEYHTPVKYNNAYAAWWYCAFALRKSEGYPGLVPPFFIKGDDVFFSLKNASTVMSLNGIAVRHDSFDLKYAPEFNRYFALRNLMIINTRFLRFPGIRNGLSTAFRVLAEIAVYNYRSAELCLRAFRDYQKGPRFLMSANHGNILMELKSDPEILLPVDRLFDPRWDDNRKISPIRKLLKVLIRLFSLSGHLVPTIFLRKETVITLGYTNLSLVPVLSRSYYAVSKDNRIFVIRHINQFAGIKLIADLFLALLRYSSSGTESEWKKYFSAGIDERLAEYWKMA